METHWTFSGCDAEDETLVARYWDERLLELEGKLHALSEEPSELRVAVHHDEGPPSWEVQAALHLPGATLVADNAGEALEEVLDSVVCELARQMDEHDEQPITTAEPFARPGSAAVLALVRRNHAQGRSGAFFALLQPILRSLTNYLEHALHTLESEDGLPGEEVTLEDVLDEALARAWDRFGQFDAPGNHRNSAAHEPRSRHRPLDQWLREIVQEVLEESNHPLAQRSLEEEVAEPADDADDPLRDAWTEAGGYQQTVELAELIAGHPGVDAWDRLSAEPEGTALAELLGKLPRDQRQALVLSMTEGFSAAEIADFQGRSMSDVEEDIRLAQQTLQGALEAAASEERKSNLRGAHGRPRHPR
jgi:DNA-directed RNA polymerase specialized sigma24 family protein